ncbi:regenerating islet-derived protein 4 [Falco biarmicus]|uniref:regenerating islet-derived protein 4 n=1 Tax=Falco peregrinus TaxID=8954 RepID=UPI002478C562|nr:regenerating islet-derived protein 4 [Falco peregrinus]XP_055671045.1 regenerating islet-derived protein 4 [Falco peregrinus]XP_056211694.1 regenerating islet-derived protein 4 [Falco biarmicus]
MVAVARFTLVLLGCVGLLWPAGARYIDYCPKGWYYYKLNCFKYFSQLRSWDEAERQCQASHASAHLAWVEEPKEAATLQRVISYYQRVQPVWLGLHYGQESQAWQWVSGDKYSVTSGLARSGAHSGTCGILTHLSGFTLWSSADCSQRHHYVCKFSPVH